MLIRLKLLRRVWPLAAVVLLAACGASVADPTPAPTESPVPRSEATADPNVTTTTIVNQAGEEVEIMTQDDRSTQLQRITASWETDWTRHTINYADVLSGGPPRDGIPSIDNPRFVSADEASDWLADNEPVIALTVNGESRAYPLQILTWHEIVNDTIGGVPVVVTFCPLCNSALAFERTFGEFEFEFGVSGLLLNSDLIMYDRQTETLWQQFTGEGVVGSLAGEQLTFVPSQIVSFADFATAFPDSEILSRDTGFSRDYGRNPYSGYDTIGNNPFLFNGPLDGRLPAVARVVTVSLDNVDIAYPVETLSERRVIHDEQDGQSLVVFHVDGTSSALGAGRIADAEDVGATGVFDPIVDGQKLTFTAAEDGFVDAETGSTWNIFGQAIAGDLEGTQLVRIGHGDHFWFSWAAFKPDTLIWEPAG